MNVLLKNKFISGVLAILILGGGIYLSASNQDSQANSLAENEGLCDINLIQEDEENCRIDSAKKNDTLKAIVYKTPTCGCCGLYTKYLEENGFDVETKMLNDLSPIRAKHGIASNMESCHTVEIGDYFVEGHVPIEAVNKMLAELPDIDGIALPEMPIGTPGMPGIQRQDWHISAITNGNPSEFMTFYKK